MKSCGRTEGWAGRGELGLWTPFQVFGGHWSTSSSTWKQGHSSFLGVKVWGGSRDVAAKPGSSPSRCPGDRCCCLRQNKERRLRRETTGEVGLAELAKGVSALTKGFFFFFFNFI